MKNYKEDKRVRKKERCELLNILMKMQVLKIK